MNEQRDLQSKITQLESELHALEHQELLFADAETRGWHEDAKLHLARKLRALRTKLAAITEGQGSR